MTYQCVAYVVNKAKALRFLGQLFLVGLHAPNKLSGDASERARPGDIDRRRTEGVVVLCWA